jgi:hypothetical protein
MIRRMLTRFRIVAPPTWSVLAFLGLFVLLEGSVAYFERLAGLRLDLRIRPGQFLLTSASAFLGMFRAIAFHPTLRPDYFEWLKNTPWTVQKPLPIGPIELVPEDSVAMGGLMLLAFTQPTPDSINLANTFLCAHLIVLTLSLVGKSVPGFVYGALLLLGTVPQLRMVPWLGLAVLVGTYLFVHEGLWRVLVHFPRGKDGIPDESPERNLHKAQGTSCGWPFDRLHGDVRRAFPIKPTDAALGCMLGGWWVWGLFSLIDDRSTRLKWLQGVVIFVLGFSPVVRLWVYRVGYGAPISFWGRLRTFRWIIPGYDQIFVGPICSVLGGLLVLSFLGTRWMPVDICLLVAAGCSLFLALIAPPDLRRWYLTGHHRLAPTGQDTQSASANAGSS